VAKKAAPPKRKTVQKSKPARGKPGSRRDPLEELTEADLQRVVGGSIPDGNWTIPVKLAKPRTGRLR
jgi:hypothetical protein